MPHGRVVAGHDGEVQRAGAVFALDVEVCVVVNQKLGDGGSSVECGDHERGVA